MTLKVRTVKIRTLKQAVIAISSISALLNMGVALLYRIPVWTWFATAAVTFFIIYFICLFFINRYIIFRIKPLYQVLMSKDIHTSTLKKEILKNKDIADDIKDNLGLLVGKSGSEIARLKENEKFRKEFLGNVSHELKTPVFNAQGYILTLLDGGMEDEAINRKYLERADKSLTRLINIIKDLDVISELEAGELNLELEEFDISALARDIAESAERIAAQRNMRIRVGTLPQAPGMPIMVYADKRRIGQVLNNLIVNSVKYGFEESSVTVSFIDIFDKILVEVTDTGIGIPPEDIPRIFERFYRADKSRSREQGGTGLGLAIVKHIIEVHNEKITLRSVVNKGTTFSFTMSKKSLHLH